MTDAISQDFAARLIAHLPVIRRYAMTLCRNRSLADDLVQDTVERALTSETGPREPEYLAAWLRRIAHNLFIDQLRRKHTRGVEVDVTDMENDPAFSTAPHDRSGHGDVMRAMARLSVEHRQILVLAGVEQLSYREIADELGVPLGTVMSRLARARMALRAALEPASPEPRP